MDAWVVRCHLEVSDHENLDLCGKSDAPSLFPLSTTTRVDLISACPAFVIHPVRAYSLDCILHHEGAISAASDVYYSGEYGWPWCW